MVDLDQRVADGLRELVGHAPVDADVWPAARQHVTRRRRRRHLIAAAVVAVALGGSSLATVAVVARAHSTHGVSDPGPTPERSPLSASGPVEGSFTITAMSSIKYEPARLTVATGIYSVTLSDGANGGHTLRFADSATLSSDLVVNTAGENDSTRVFFGRPGDYVFFCVIPGHRAAGEQGVVHVTGPTITLAQAEAEASNVG